MSIPIEGDKIDVELIGSRGLGSRRRVDPAVIAEGRLKVQFGAGYEHFDLDHYADRGGTSVPVFVCTHRTWIAE